MKRISVLMNDELKSVTADEMFEKWKDDEKLPYFDLHGVNIKSDGNVIDINVENLKFLAAVYIRRELIANIKAGKGVANVMKEHILKDVEDWSVDDLLGISEKRMKDLNTATFYKYYA